MTQNQYEKLMEKNKLRCRFMELICLLRETSFDKNDKLMHEHLTDYVKKDLIKKVDDDNESYKTWLSDNVAKLEKIYENISKNNGLFKKINSIIDNKQPSNLFSFTRSITNNNEANYNIRTVFFYCLCLICAVPLDLLLYIPNLIQDNISLHKANQLKQALLNLSIEDRQQTDILSHNTPTCIILKEQLDFYKDAKTLLDPQTPEYKH